MQPFSALDHAVKVSLEGEHCMDIPFGDRHAADDTHPRLKSAFKIRLPCGEIAYMRAYCLLHAEVVPHKNMVGNCYGTVSEFLFMLFKVFFTVDAKPVGKMHQGENDKIQKDGDARTLKHKHFSAGHILVVLIKMYLPCAF